MECTVSSEEVTRPLYYKKFKSRVQRFSFAGKNGEFNDDELRAIVADYYFVVYEKMWKGEDKFPEHEIELAILRHDNEHLTYDLITAKSQLATAKDQLERSWWVKFMFLLGAKK